MSEELERRWDDAVETAWREFRQRLADRLAGMAEGDSIVVEVVGHEVQGTRPYCQVAAGDGVLRVEAVSNVYLAVECEIDVSQEGALVHLGFDPPETDDWSEGETNFWADVEQREADRAAVMVVDALRDGVRRPPPGLPRGRRPRAAADGGGHRGAGARSRRPHRFVVRR